MMQSYLLALFSVPTGDLGQTIYSNSLSVGISQDHITHPPPGEDNSNQSSSTEMFVSKMEVYSVESISTLFHDNTS